ncbi:MAG: S1 RNA-binding domain-containing protein, partial [Clostridia bacterium]|nr:S1 RNA-binding domain-containing protein [Clostridia bacterium]
LDKRRVDSSKNWQKVVAAKEEGTVLEAVVSEVVKGGLTVFVYGNRVFIPASQSGVPKDGDLAPLKGTNVKFKVIETKEPGNKAIGSIRVVLREERRAAEEAFWAEIEEGKTYTGAVKSMTAYGAFIDLGGVDGMVHTSELSWKRIKSPADVLSVGEVVTVFVKSFDKEKKRISLGYKTEESNPWFIFTNQYQVGDVVPVKIVSMMPFGAFAEIIDGVDGLIHISQIAMTRIGKPADVLEIGQSVDAKIIEIDSDKQKVSLSIRALLEEVAAAEAAMPEEAAEEATEETAE